VPATIRFVDNRVGGDTVKITTLMVMALLFGSLTQALHLEAVLGAFIVGILFGEVKRFDHHVRHSFEQLTVAVFAPVFFATAGLRVDLGAFWDPTVFAVALVVLAVAIVGKFAGAYAGARLSRLGHWEALSLGAGMNERGALEIIVATIGLSLGVLTDDMYSIVVVTAIVTSLMALALLRWTLSKVEMGDEERERLEAEERQRESFVGNLKRVLLPAASRPSARLAARLVDVLVAGQDVRSRPCTCAGPRTAPTTTPTVPATRLRTPWTRSRVTSTCPSPICVASSGSGARTTRSAPWCWTRRGRATTCSWWAPPASAGRGTARCSEERSTIWCRRRRARCSSCGRRARTPSRGRATSRPSGPRADPCGACCSRWPGGEMDRAAAEVALSLGSDSQAIVDVIHVVRGGELQSRISDEETTRSAMQVGEELVASVAELGHHLGATVHTQVVVADHEEEALVERARSGIDLTVLAASRAPVTQRAFFGHHIDHVLRNAPCPVVVVSSP
jgi:nucleotide-binding universal stress UspA family protein/small basic protein